MSSYHEMMVRVSDTVSSIGTTHLSNTIDISLSLIGNRESTSVMSIMRPIAALSAKHSMAGILGNGISHHLVFDKNSTTYDILLFLSHSQKSDTPHSVFFYLIFWYPYLQCLSGCWIRDRDDCLRTLYSYCYCMDT